jgi:hypothetical protein
MKKIGSFLVVFMLFAAFFASFAAGSDSYSIKVSCTIPAVPGINVPIIEEEQPATPQEIMAFNSKKQEAQLEKEQLTPSGEEGSSLVLVKSIYTR